MFVDAQRFNDKFVPVSYGSMTFGLTDLRSARTQLPVSLGHKYPFPDNWTE